MKKFIVTSLLPSLLLAGGFNGTAFAGETPVVPTPVTVDGGKINFSGSIVATPCAVDSDSDGQTVKLGQVPANHFTAADMTTSPVPFTIKLTGCKLNADTSGSAYTSAAITFRGTTVADKSSVLALASASGSGDTVATNVGIQILQSGKPLIIDGSSSATKQTLLAGSNSLDFSAEYIATSASVTAGSANSSIDFQVTYS